MMNDITQNLKRLQELQEEMDKIGQQIREADQNSQQQPAAPAQSAPAQDQGGGVDVNSIVTQLTDAIKTAVTEAIAPLQKQLEGMGKGNQQQQSGNEDKTKKPDKPQQQQSGNDQSQQSGQQQQQPAQGQQQQESFEMIYKQSHLKGDN